MASSSDIVKQSAALIEKVLAETITAKDAIDSWPQSDDKKLEKILKNTYEQLHHFYSEEDIHKKDEGYKKYQVGLLKQSIIDIKKFV